MKVEKVDSAQSFKALNVKRVIPEHKHFIESDIEKLKEFGEKYDIKMKSCVNNELRCDGMFITVRDLKEKFGFIKKFFRPKGESYFYTTPHYTADTKDMTLVGQVQKAIENLKG